MEFEIKEKPNPNARKFNPNDLTIVRNFASEMVKEFGTFIKCITIFGSAIKGVRKGTGDIDILVVVDDITIRMTPEVVETYRIITEKIINKVSTKLHVVSLKFTAFWDYVRNGDPIIMNILRNGAPLIDQNFFTPIQYLLQQGRIRPSMEAIYSYFERSPKTLYNSRWHVIQATLDLYWAVVDSAHSALMKMEVTPPTPAEIGDLLEKELLPRKMISKKQVITARKFYKLMKLITHREVRHIEGKEYDEYYKEAEEFVKSMEKIVKGKEGRLT